MWEKGSTVPAPQHDQIPTTLCEEPAKSLSDEPLVRLCDNAVSTQIIKGGGNRLSVVSCCVEGDASPMEVTPIHDDESLTLIIESSTTQTSVSLSSTILRQPLASQP